VAVTFSLENRRSVFPGGLVEGEERSGSSSCDTGAPTGYHEAPGCTVDVSRTLKRLAEHGLVTFAKQGGERRIGYGPRLLEAWREPRLG
jgi:hypothetical protein